MSRKQIALEEVLTSAMDRMRGSMYFRFPGIVQTYYADGTADIQVAVNDVRFDPDGSVTGTAGARIPEPFPILPKVKIAYPSGGGFSITWPLAAGSKVTLEAYDLDPTAHQLSGNQEDPNDVRRHGGAYWKAVPEDITNGAPTPTAGQITINGPGITLGAGATDFVALASKVASELTAIKTALTTLSVPITGPVGTTPVVAGTPYTGPGVIASAVVQCK